jgi:hypothetical protein
MQREDSSRIPSEYPAWPTQKIPPPVHGGGIFYVGLPVHRQGYFDGVLARYQNDN